MQKKILIFSIIGAVAIFGAIGGWLLFENRGDSPSEEKSDGFFASFFPGGEDRGISPREGETSAGKGEKPDSKRPRLTKIFEGGVAWPVYASTSVRFVEKATGNVYESKTDGRELERISNNTILGVFNSIWSPDGESFVVQYADDEALGNLSVNSYLSSLSSVNSTSTEKGVFLPKDATALSSHPSEKSFFYLAPAGGTNVGIIASFDGKTKKQIFTIPFSEFFTQWAGKNLYLQTKASALENGILFSADLKTGTIKSVLAGKKGLTALVSPDEKNILHSESADKSFFAFIYNIEKKEATELSQKTLPEKCAWSKKESVLLYCAIPEQITPADYPDAWYQGLVSFTDGIWKIDLLTGALTKIAQTDADVEGITIDANEEYLIFQNKKDGSLWSLRIAE